MSTASISAEKLLNHFVSSGTLTEAQVVSLLGSDRAAPTVNGVEMAMVDKGVVSDEKMQEVVAELSGRQVFAGPLDAAVPAGRGLPAAVALGCGALLLNDASRLTVAFVEDTADNVAAVAEVLGRQSFDIVLMTATTFTWAASALYRGDMSEVPLETAGTLYDVLDAAISDGASDIHLKVGLPPKIRTSGSLVALEFDRLTEPWMRAQAERIAEERHLAELAETFSTDLAYTYGDVRFRVNIARDSAGYTMALRRLPSKIPDASVLGLPPLAVKLSRRERGLYLVTGPTGSGKTTTLAALLAELCHEPRHLITLEDPIEFVLPTKSAAQVNQRELGASFPSFPEGLRDALRQDPDIVLVGELRDVETIETAFTAAETGHMVFATVHTHDAASTVARLVNSFPQGARSAIRVQLAQLLQCVVSQTLLPRAGGKGRVGAYEVMANTTAVAANLRKEDGHNQLKQEMASGLDVGMQLMEAALAKLVVSGAVSREDAKFKARDPLEFDRMLAYYSSQAEATRGRNASAPLSE